MTQVVTKQFDGTRKAIFTMNFKIASTTAETFTIVPANLNNSNGIYLNRVKALGLHN